MVDLVSHSARLPLPVGRVAVLPDFVSQKKTSLTDYTGPHAATWPNCPQPVGLVIQNANKHPSTTSVVHTVSGLDIE